MRSIRAQLLFGLSVGIVASILVALTGAYTFARVQAGHAFDFHLQQIAETAPDHIHVGYSPRVLDAEEFILLEIWDSAGNVLYASRSNMLVPRQHRKGLQTIDALGKRWRVYVEMRNGHTIQVSQLIDERDELVLQLTLSAVLPMIAMIPLLAGLVVVVVNRSLKPLQFFAQAVSQRTPDRLEPVVLPQSPPEVVPVMRAINALIERLKQALAAQKDFIADAAHELRTPLAALRLQMPLAENATTDEARAQAFAKLYLRLNRAERLVGQLLRLARQDAGQSRIADERVDLCEAAKSAVGEFLLPAQARRIDLGVDARVDVLPVCGVRADLDILLHCLIDNAVRYSPPEGRVDVALTVRGDRPQLAVIDNGPGIPPTERERVFDRFYRGESATDVGSGLGLAIAQKIAIAHGATIAIEDNPDSRGIRVVVVFPPCRADCAPVA